MAILMIPAASVAAGPPSAATENESSAAAPERSTATPHERSTATPHERSTAAPHERSTAAPCRVVEPTRNLRRTLRRVHVRTLRRQIEHPIRIRGPLGRVYYGRCGATRYALATFSHKIGGLDLGTQDQPKRFRRLRGGRWRDRGDTGGLVCTGVAPRQLIQLWGFDCTRVSGPAAAR
jgi:hypothetical protein